MKEGNYSYAVGARWMLSAVARIYRPGAKADYCVILEGPQGIKKSTALRTLAGEYFTDELADWGSKDAALQIRGVWIVEISELDSLVRSEIASIKAFMSRSADRFRPPFGKRVVECQRQCVFAGTVNHTEYLRDETGARRSWRFCAAPSTSRHSREIVISFGPKRDTDTHPVRNGGWIRPPWPKSPPKNRLLVIKATPGKKSSGHGWKFVRTRLFRKCWKNA